MGRGFVVSTDVLNRAAEGPYSSTKLTPSMKNHKASGPKVERVWRGLDHSLDGSGRRRGSSDEDSS